MAEAVGMNRREALGAGALAGAMSSALGAAGCAHLRRPWTHDSSSGGTLSSDELTAFLSYFDRSLLEIERSEFVAGFATKSGPAAKSELDRARIDEAEAEFRETIAALFASQSFRELPLESQLHPEVQRRMRRRVESIDASVKRSLARIEGLSSSRRAALQKTLRQNPDLGMTISEAVTREAARVGVSAARRRQFRAMMTDIGLRMKSQGGTRTLDEIAAHLRRIAEPGSFHHRQALALAHGDPEPFLGTAGAEALRRTAAWTPSPAKSEFWERWAADPDGQNERLTAAALRQRAQPVRAEHSRRPAFGSVLETSAASTKAAKAARRARPHSSKRRPRSGKRSWKVIRVGLIMFGLGLLVTAAGAVLLTVGSPAGLILITPGALSTAASLIVLMVGLSMANGEEAE